MKITYEIKDYKFVTIFVDDDCWKDVGISIFGKKPAISDKISTLEELNGWFQLAEYQGAKRFSLRRVAAKSLHSLELKKLLGDCLVSEGVIKRILLEFKDLGFINDADWIESFIRGQKARKRGPRAIIMKLKAKGINTENLVFDKESSQESISKLLQSKFRSRDLSDPKERNKVVGSLIRKGFDLEDILQEVKNLSHLKIK